MTRGSDYKRGGLGGGRAAKAQSSRIATVLWAWVLALAIMSLLAPGAIEAHAAVGEGDARVAVAAVSDGYPIVYKLKGGLQPSGQLANVGKGKSLAVSELKIPKRLGFKFLGWYADAKFKEKAKFVQGSAKVSKRTVYAKWRRVAWPIVYKLNGGTAAKSHKSVVALGKKAKTTTLGNPTRKGYRFLGWYADKKLAHKAFYVKGAKAKSTRTVYAKWKVKTYSITYKVSGGKLPASYVKSFNVTKKVKSLPKPVRAGYKFMGWFSDKKLTRAVVSIPKGSTGNKVLYAKWAPVTYKIAYVLDGGSFSGNAPATFTRLAKTVIPEPSKQGYSFLGWYSDSAFETLCNEIPAGSKGNKKLYAKWRKRVLLAHRGLRANAPENSLKAFEDAALRGFLQVETDVRFTSDGVPVLFHDETVELVLPSEEPESPSEGGNVEEGGLGMDDGTPASEPGIEPDPQPVTLAIAELSYEQLQNAAFTTRAKSGTDGNNVATFEECMACCRRLGLEVRIHLKTSEEQDLQTLVEMADIYGMSDRVQWFSNDIGALRYVKELDPDACFVYSHPITKTALKNAKSLEGSGADVLCYYTLSTLGPTQVNLCKEQGMPLGTWGVTDEEAAAKVDPYICSILVDGLVGRFVPELIGA